MTHGIIDFLQSSHDVLRHTTITSIDELRQFHRENKQPYLYLISWNENTELEFGAWGKSSGKSKRLRKAMVFDTELTGKYDRRVDYLIAKRLWGSPAISIFSIANMGSALRLEQEIGSAVVHPNRKIPHCFYCHTEANIPASRSDVSEKLLNLFRQNGFGGAPQNSVTAFIRYWDEVFLRPKEQRIGNRTFCYGDSLEPKYLVRKFSKNGMSLEEITSIIVAIETVLGVSNLRGREP